MKFEGIITALATPFFEGDLDKKSFINLIKNQLDEGVDGFVINGTTGESPTLTEPEVCQLIEWAQGEISNQAPLILGVGHNNTKQAQENIELARKWNMDGVLAVTPYYNKPSQEGLLKHFKVLASASELPLLLYNVPSRTQVAIEIPTILELSRESQIVGIKEASGDKQFFKSLLSSSLPKDFTVTSGDDGTFLELIQEGGHGVISVSSHFLLKPMKEFLNRVLEKDSSAISDFQKQYQPLIDCLFSVSNPMMVKQVLYLKKIIRSPELRLPLCEPSSSLVEKMTKLLKEKSLL